MPVPLINFHYAYQKPKHIAEFRRSPSDFVVEELIDFELSGSGEHFWLKIQKVGENTEWLAKKLANYFSVRKMDVGYGGKKDRHAVTTQWFSVYLPGKEHVIDWPAFIEMSKVNAELIEQGTHDKKLKKGQHESNRFEITLYGLKWSEDLQARLESVSSFGVPNYYGMQRFGRDGGNLEKVERWVSDPRSIRDRNLRGLIISSARSYLFNTVLSMRVHRDRWLTRLDGEPSLSTDTTEIESTTLLSSEEKTDADRAFNTSGPLWGRGRPLSKGELLEIENEVLAEYKSWCDALEMVGLNQERRALVLKPGCFQYEFKSTDNNENALVLNFMLGSGEYATSVLRELSMLEEPKREYNTHETK